MLNDSRIREEATSSCENLYMEALRKADISGRQSATAEQRNACGMHAECNRIEVNYANHGYRQQWDGGQKPS